MTAALDRDLALYGTGAAPEMRPVRLGDTVLTLEGAAIRQVSWRGLEVLRGLEFLVRGADWATLAPETPACDVEVSGDGLTLRARQRYRGDGGVLDVRLELEAWDGGLTFRAKGDVAGRLATNRAGFVLLHPLHETRGQGLTVTHTDGTQEQTVFPALVSPGQPAFDVRALSYVGAGGTRVRVTFNADEAFEMEDQRNWTDASFKTYFRPLALPRPYVLAGNAALGQSVSLSFGSEGLTPKPLPPFWQDAPAGLPTLGVALGEQTGALTGRDERAVLSLRPGRMYAWLDLRGEGWPERLTCAERLATSANAILNLEVVLPEGGEDAALTRLAAELPDFTGELTALPQAYLRSYQPAGPWPQGMTPGEALRAARRRFPHARLGAGSLGFFTEFNRCPPAPDADFVTHGTSALVHAADDAAVMGTLEALPDVFASVRKLAGGVAYLVGPSFIGLRFDPDGGVLDPNARGRRVTRTAHDPRQGALFGAAWTLGYVARAAAAGVSGVAPAECAGPFGLCDEAGLRPAYHVLRGLWTEGTGRWQSHVDSHLAALQLLDGPRRMVWLANLTPDEQDLPGNCAHAAFALLGADSSGTARHDADFLQKPQSGRLTRLPPYVVARLVGGPL